MKEKKEFLNEENYEKSKRKITTIALIILILGVLIGGSLILTGILKTAQAKKHNEEVVRQIDANDKTRSSEDIQADIDNLKSQMADIDKEIEDIEAEIANLEREKIKIFQDDRGFSDRYYAKEDEINKKEKEKSTKRTERSNLSSKILEYESELWKADSGYNDTEKEIEKRRNMISSGAYTHYYIIGGMIIVVFGMIALSIYMFAKRREILAFQAQQIIPVAQEGIEKVAPTLGKAKASIVKEVAPAYGNMAKEITKGIKEGINGDKEELKEEPNEKDNKEEK